MATRKKECLSTRLLTWYRKNGRTLPWRGLHDPYAIWVSEIMLQQTRVETVIPYFNKWMQRFPNIKTLARASETDVLNAWEGLGYYSRARNLLKAAQHVLEQHHGELPQDLDELRNLPGIGRYTAGALASIAFKLDQPTLDANLRRVFTRLFNIEVPADSAAGEKILWDLAAEHLPKGHAGDYNQALMDLGANICIPKNPKCELCPLTEICQALAKGVQELRPVMKPKKDRPHYFQAAGAIIENTKVLLAKRPAKGLLGGMWEFPNGRIEAEPAKELENTLEREYSLRVQRGAALGVIRHAYTHFKTTVYAFECKPISISTSDTLKWIHLLELDNFPMGKVDRQIANILYGKI